MGENDVVVIHCSGCRTRIPVKDLLADRAVSVGQYCFCSSCLDKNELDEIRRIARNSDTREKEYVLRKKVVFTGRR